MDVSYPIPGDIGYVVVGSARLTVELDLPSLRALPRAIVTKRVQFAAERALAAARRHDGVVELLLRNPGDFGDFGGDGLEAFPGGDA